MTAPCWRVWTYRAPAIVLGCSQHALGEEIRRRLGGRAELLTRESGGGAVLTGPWLVSASVVLPHAHPWVHAGLVDSYRWLGQLHVTVLNEFGIRCRALPPKELARTNDSTARKAANWACFGSLSPWEVVNAEGRKLVGLAQRRRQSGVLLVAGTLLGAVDWSLFCEAMGHPQDAPNLRQCTVSVEDLTPSQIKPERFAGALTRSLDNTFSAT